MVKTTPDWQAALGGLKKECSWWEATVSGFPENGDSYKLGMSLAEIPRSYACGVVTKDTGFYLGRGAAQPSCEHGDVESTPHTWVVTGWVGGVRE